MNSKTLHRAALELPPDERAELAQKLLLSLDDPSDEELAQTWLTEAERRARQLDCGEVRPVAAEEVRRKARALLLSTPLVVEPTFSTDSARAISAR